MIAYAVKGSSPLMRGARHGTIILNCAIGIIPAYAGSTAGFRVAEFRHTDHPRLCGEHPGATRTAPPGTGSSPLMRGAHFFTSEFTLAHRRMHSKWCHDFGYS